MGEDFKTEDDITEENIRKNLNRASPSTFNMDEMKVYYKGDKKLVNLIVELAKTRKRLKKTTDSEARKAIQTKITKLTNNIRQAQFAFYNRLKKIQVIGSQKEMRAGLITEHPSEKIFSLKQNEPVSLPVNQAKQLIKEGIALEVK